MSPTRSRAVGQAAALSLTLVGTLALPAAAADSPEGAVNALIDAVEGGDFASIDALVCEAERDSVLAMFDPGEAMGLSAGDLPISFRFDDRALEVVSEDGDEVTIRLTGTMSMDVDEAEMESVARALLEAEMGEASDEDIEQMLPFMMMAFSQTASIDEEVTVVSEDGDWLVCGGLGDEPVTDGFEDELSPTIEVPAEGVCALATPEELTAVGQLEYDTSSGWELTTCTYSTSDWEAYHNTTVTVELDSDAAYAAGAYGADQELEVAGAPAFTMDQPNSPLIVQVGPDVLNVTVWAPEPAPDGYDGTAQAVAIAELFAPRVTEARASLIAPTRPLLCELTFAGDFEAAMGSPLHSGSVSEDYCNFESRDLLYVNAGISQGTLDDHLMFYPGSEETTLAGLRALHVEDEYNPSAYVVRVELPGEQVLDLTVQPYDYDKPLSVSGSEVAELLTQHIVDKLAE
jgi:hypothetical protein